MELSPILLFVYNRPQHTKKVLDALANNFEAQFSTLIIFSDGLKDNVSEKEIELKNQLSEIIKSENRFKEVIIHESKINKGLAKSIIKGVTESVQQYGKVIVLEDDIIVSNYFLKFMNDALDTYQDVKEVMHVSAYIYPFNKSKSSGTFFYKPTSCWGWATWKDSWSFFEKNPEKQIQQFEYLNAWDEFTVNQSMPTFRDQLFQNLNGEINTWAIFWYASVFLNGGTSLHPLNSLTLNIGMDGSGENCGDLDEYNPYNKEIYQFPIQINKKNDFVSLNENRKVYHYIQKNINLKKSPTQLSLRDKFYLFRQKFF